MAIQSVNPATGEKIKVFTPLSEKEIEQKLEKAAASFRFFKKTRFAERAAWMFQAAQILESEKKKWGEIITTEIGRPIRASYEEIEKCARTCRFYAENAERFLQDEIIKTNADQSYVRYQPLGVILAVMPWNFPFWQVIRFAAPALMAGNVGLLKHASNVPQCALALEEIFTKAGFPEGVFQSLLVTGEQVERLGLLKDDRIAAATFTGSDEVGASIGSVAAKNIKKTVLELGGSDPFIVTPNACLNRTIEMAVKARMRNNGQSCNAAKRFIVIEAIVEKFTRKFIQALQALKIGDPMDPSTDVGPLAMQQTLNTIERQVQESVRLGAKILTGGKRLDRPGFYYEPTILTNIPKEAPAYHQEVFGPVALLFVSKDLDQALWQANSSRYGLGASLWSEDSQEQAQFIEEIASGSAFVNAMVTSDPRVPFGGIKRSGFGRELGRFGIQEFVNIKTVWINESLSPMGKEGCE